MIPKLLLVMGPTSSGKTAVSCEIAKKIPCELISCDSMQVYQRMPVLTQAPTARERKILKAHLVSFIDPKEAYDAARFRNDATQLIDEILKKKKTPLISGGTGLYLRALLDGLFESDASRSRDEKLRKKLSAEEMRHGAGFLHEKLKALDPVSAGKIHPNDVRRVIRALEVSHLTGKPFSEQKTRREGIRHQFHCPVFFLERDRQDLYDRINARVDVMAKKGLIPEVKKLRASKIGLTASTVLGLREVGEYLEKRCTREEALTRIKQFTRNYAKRQLSWFRHERGVVPIPVAPREKPAVTAQRILKMWRQGPS